MPAIEIDQQSIGQLRSLVCDLAVIFEGLTAERPTLRDYFAARALPALVAANADLGAGLVAIEAYALADAMLAVRQAPAPQ